MKDTKGVRQVLEEVHKAHYDTIDGTDGCNVSIEKAESALQEIMLGMLPEEREVIEPSNPYEYQTRSEQQGWNAALTKVKQNIRGGFNNG